MMARKGLNCFCQETNKSSQRRPLSVNVSHELPLSTCGNLVVKENKNCIFKCCKRRSFFRCPSMHCHRREINCFGLNSSRQTMYDFVNEWSPGQKGRQGGQRPSKSQLFNDPLRLFSQSKGCYINLELDEDNCQCTSHAKTARRRRLRSKSGFYLTIMPNGQVLGVKDPTNNYISLDVIPVGADLVKIWGVEAELFLMIDDAGLLRATDVDGPECIFEETMTEDFCTVYYSTMYSHKQWCVGLKTRPLSTFSGAFRRNKLSLRDCSFLAEIVNRRSSTSSSQSCSSDGRMSSI